MNEQGAVKADREVAVRQHTAGRRYHSLEPARKPDPRAIATQRRIFEATTRVMLRSGVEGMSIQDIAGEAGVARGTLYRYFSSKNELLDAYTGFMRTRFDAALRAAITPHTQPAARLDAFLEFFEDYLNSTQARSFLEAEPEFALGYFRRSFGDGVAKARDALGPVFDHWSEKIGRPLDHTLLAELIMRFLLSDVLVPVNHDRKGIARKLMALAEHLA